MERGEESVVMGRVGMGRDDDGRRRRSTSGKGRIGEG